MVSWHSRIAGNHVLDQGLLKKLLSLQINDPVGTNGSSGLIMVCLGKCSFENFKFLHH